MKKLQLIHTILLCRFACGFPAFLAVWGGQTEREASFAGVLCVPLVHDVQKRNEVIVLRGGAVHIVVDSYETNALLREKNLRVIADLQAISAKTAKVFYNQDFHMTCFDFFQQGGKAGTVER